MASFKLNTAVPQSINIKLCGKIHTILTFDVRFGFSKQIQKVISIIKPH